MCGIFGILNCTNKNNVLPELVHGLRMLQHRGKDGYGISYVQQDSQMIIRKSVGLVQNLNECDQQITSCIGHVRYSTSGNSKDTCNVDNAEIQPLVHEQICLVHNGNIPNISGHDTLYLLQTIAQYLSTHSIEDALIHVLRYIPSSYSVIIQYNNSLFVLKDRFGVRPLSYGFKHGNVYIASETVALHGCSDITEVRPGQILKFENDQPIQIYQSNNVHDYFCVFELLYFMHPHSSYHNLSVEEFRKTMTHKIIRNEILDRDDFVVVGVPSSGVIYAQEYAKVRGLSYVQCIEKQDKRIHGEDRTFTILDSRQRNIACRKKFAYKKEDIRNKKIIVFDDTIVRGTVMRQIVRGLRENGAIEIHIRIPAPPVVDICQLGIAIHDKEELIMYKRTIQQVQELLCVDSLQYLSLDDLPSRMYTQCFGGGIHPEIISLTQ